MQIGDIVIFVDTINGKLDKSPAIVTKVHPDNVLNLFVMIDRSDKVFSIQQPTYKNYVPRVDSEVALNTYWEPKDYWEPKTQGA